MKPPRTLACLACGLAGSLAQAASTRLVIESVDGDQVAVVYHKGQPHPAKRGEELEEWDVIQTSKRSAVKLRYADGSTVVVGRDTKYEIQPRSEGTQFNQLSWGQVRAQVEKPASDQKKPDKAEKSDSKPPPRFVIRTKTAVMGVRGTDFVAGFDPATGQSALHTLEGTVDMGGSESQVMSWQGTPVTAGHTASLVEGTQAPAVADFSPQVYEAEVKASNPALVAMADTRGEDGKLAPPAGIERSSVAMPAQETKNPEERSDLSLLSFRAGPVSILQFSKIAFTTGGAAWSPVYRFLGPLHARGYAGAFLVKNGDTGALFPVFKVGALLDAQITGPIHAEAGAGYQMFKTDTVGMIHKPYLMANAALHLGKGVLDHFYGGVSRIFLVESDGGGDIPLEIAAGVGLRF